MSSPSQKLGSSDSEIIEGLLAGGPPFEKYALVLYRMCENYIHEAVKKHPLLEAADIHDAYIDAVDAVIKKVLSNQFKKEVAKLSTLLYQIFSNKCIDQLRRVTNHKHEWQRNLNTITEDLPVKSQDFLQSMMEQDDMNDILSVMEKLAHGCKELIMDFDYWGFKPEEVAERKGYKTGKSASQAKYRCMEELRKLIKDEQVTKSAKK
ncbi:sigma-70 family RNA polymerase sigma factor [Fulvivirga sp. M361]|uniref:RNA polymerase sigma factor n=1 Tax=Fulvivirga sp. M361 TaxID=2594266 RepID=UPI00117A4099|nr:sigma-70 family RNA polymerase sigma factor [Fulvivirga sp. M361]TRX62616.1 sigma-70 family RNA polymerase sigma factor [Fulvivirga sp. M361]